MGLTSELKIRRFENVFLFFSFFKIGPKLRDPPPKIHPPKPETGTSEVLFVPEYNTWGGGGSNDPPSPQNVTPGRN
jgi:hypothetical protein